MAIYPGTAGNDSGVLTGTSVNDVFVGSAGNDTITGGGGFDIISYGAYPGYTGISGPVNVTFGSTAASLYAGSVTKTVGSIAYFDTFTGIAAVYGTNANDTLTGYSGPQDAVGAYAISLRGGIGNDRIDGQKNLFNRADYNGATAGVNVVLQSSTSGTDWFGTASDGQGGTDTLKNVVRVQGSNFNDTITGSAAADYFDGTTGNDTYNGGEGFNTVRYDGGAAPAVITATFGAPVSGLYGWGTATVAKPSSQTDTLTNVNEIRGGSGNDVLVGTTAAYSWYTLNLRGNGGSDTFYGQGNVANRVDYQSSTAAVSVDLAAGTASDGMGSTDTLVNVVNVRGSGYNDTLYGGAGDDRIEVLDTGTHLADGRGGLNRIQYDSTVAATITLGSTTAAPGGYGGYVGSLVRVGGSTDTLYNFRGATGGAGNDTITGTPLNDTLGGAAGNNQLDGGAGYDRVNFAGFTGASSTPTHGAVANLGDGVNGTATNPWSGTDTLLNIESAIGSQFADDITGAVLASGAISYITGRGGNDTIRAPTVDTHVSADYLDSLTRVIVNLGTGVTSDDGWFGGTDTLVNIQAVRGSSFADSLTGSARNDTLEGAGGNDTLVGSAGFDVALQDGGRRGNASALSGSDLALTLGSTTDTFRGVERIDFTDGSIQLDPASFAAQVMRLYDSAFGRAPDQAGLHAWVTALKAGTALTSVANGFAGSAEYQARYPNANNAAFVEQLYLNTLHRPSDPAGKAAWLDAMAHGATRAQVLTGFSESPEHQANTAPTLQAGLWDLSENAAFVARLYDTTLGRLPDLGGLSAWRTLLDAGSQSYASVVQGFTGSAEFQARYPNVATPDFVELLYVNALHRGSDPGGKAAWVNAIDGGSLTRADAVLGFSESPEHQAYTQPNVLPDNPNQFGILFA